MVHGKQIFGPCNGSKIIGQKNSKIHQKNSSKNSSKNSLKNRQNLRQKIRQKNSVKKFVKPKGQLIWKALFGILEFLQKTNEQIHS